MGTSRTSIAGDASIAGTQRAGVATSRAKRSTARGILAAILLALLAACGGGPAEPGGEQTGAAAPDEPTETAESPTGGDTGTAGDDGTAAEAPAEQLVITIVDYEYEVPQAVAPGATVLIRNEDPVTHTVTSDEEGLFNVEVPGGGEAELTVPDAAGEYPFFCIPHPFMTSTLVVE